MAGKIQENTDKYRQTHTQLTFSNLNTDKADLPLQINDLT